MMSHDEVMATCMSGSYRWTARDAQIYALGIGLPGFLDDSRELAYVYERPQLHSFPTFPVAVGFAHSALDRIGIDMSRILHGEQALTLHGSFPPDGKATGESRIVGAWDKGPGKGAVFAQETVLTLAGETSPVATVRTTTFARGDGGYGGPREGQPPAHWIPERAPDRSIEIPTSPSQALLYRLSGDAHPLHADQAVAHEAGFSRPVLHGLCTYAICCRAVLAAYHAARFSAPVFPGDTISVDLWRDGATISFEARVKARDAVVIRNGRTLLT